MAKKSKEKKPKKIGKIDKVVFTDATGQCVHAEIDGEPYTISKASGDPIWGEIEKRKIKIAAFPDADMNHLEFSRHCQSEIERIYREEIPVDLWDEMTDALKAKWKKHLKALRSLKKSASLKGVPRRDVEAAKSKFPKLPKP